MTEETWIGLIAGLRTRLIVDLRIRLIVDLRTRHARARSGLTGMADCISGSSSHALHSVGLNLMGRITLMGRDLKSRPIAYLVYCASTFASAFTSLKNRRNAIAQRTVNAHGTRKNGVQFSALSAGWKYVIMYPVN